MSGNMTIMSESETPGEGKPNEHCSREAATDSPAPVTLDDKDKDENYEGEGVLEQFLPVLPVYSNIKADHQIDSTNPANLITTIPQQSTKPTTQSQPSEQINSISDPLSNSNSDTDTIKPTYHFNDVIQPKSFPTPLARQQWESAIGWTSPWTGETFTNKLLVEYARGRWEEKPNRMTGKVEKVLVFFKPSFVDPDPWRGLVGVDEEEVERRREASREESRRLGLR